MGRFRMNSKRRIAVIATVGLIVIATISIAVSTALGFPEKERSRDEVVRELLDQDIRKADRRDQLIAEFEKRTKEMPVEQMREEYAKLNRQLEAEGLGTIMFDRGPLTRGTEIVIAGRKMRLPDNAEIRAILSNGLTPSLPRDMTESPTTVAVITRGNSSITLDMTTGRVVEIHFAPGEKNAFDFVKAHFPEHASTIDALAEAQP